MKKTITIIFAVVFMAGCAAHICPPEDTYIITQKEIVRIPKGYISDGHAMNEKQVKELIEKIKKLREKQKNEGRYGI
jgi:hypothetical protein